MMFRAGYRGVQVATIVGLLAVPASLAGQTVIASPAEAEACLARIPSSAMKAAIVHAAINIVVPSDNSGKLVLPLARAVNHATAIQARKLLGASDDAIAHAEPMVSWQAATGSLRITAHRSGKLNAADAKPMVTDANGAGVALLGTAYVMAVGEGLPFEWPSGVMTDSIVFDLELTSAPHDSTGAEMPVRALEPEPVFAVMMPWQKPPRQTRGGRIVYPRGLTTRGVTGFLKLRFVVDTSGRAEMETVEDIWPSDRPRLTGDMGAYYNAFLSAVRKGLRHARYQPARIGGCTVRMLVEQAFDFSLAR